VHGLDVTAGAVEEIRCHAALVLGKGPKPAAGVDRLRAEPFLDGCRAGAVWGTSWHGTLESDAFRRAFLTEVAALAGRDFTVSPDTDFAALRQARLDVLGGLVADHLDTAALGRLIDGGPPPGLPVIGPAGPGSLL